MIRIFISHSSKDKVLAKHLVRAIEARMNIRRKEIRCTSVDGYRLPVGVNTARKLKKEISQAKAVVGIVTPHSLNSSYVLFELGAAWGLGIATFPLLAKGAKGKELPGPLAERNAARLTKRSETRQALDDLCSRTKIERKDDDKAGSRVLIDTIVKSAKG